MSQADKDRYRAAANSMQSGVAWEISTRPEDAATSPKHLRVGINSALVDSSAIARLLLDKGIITMDEYEAALADAMEAEAKRYERILSDALGRPITLA